MEGETAIVLEKNSEKIKVDVNIREEIRASIAFYEVKRKIEEEEYIETIKEQLAEDGEKSILEESFLDRNLKVLEFIRDVSVLASKMPLILFQARVEELTLELLERTYGILGRLHRKETTVENEKELTKARKQVYTVVKRITDQCIPLDLIEEVRGFGCKYRIKEERRYLEEGSKRSKILFDLKELNIRYSAVL